MVSPPDWLVPSTLPASTDTEHPCTATESPVPDGMGCRAQGKAGSPLDVEMGPTFHKPPPMFHRGVYGVSSCQILISTLGGARGEGLRSTH